MANISDIVHVTVSLLASAVKQPGFGTMLIASYHTRFSEQTRTYSDLDGMVSDGFTVTDQAYKAAAAAFSQDPQPEQVIVGRRAAGNATQIDLYPTAVNLKVYTVKVTLSDGSIANPSYTSDGTATVAEIVIGLAAAIDALTGVAASGQSSNTFIRVTGETSPLRFSVQVPDRGLLRLENTTADAGIATDLANFKIANGNWYGVTLTSQSLAEIEAAAVWVEANNRLMVQGSADGDIVSSSTSDVASALKTGNYHRTGLFFHPNPEQHVGAAVFGAVLPFDPGSVIFAFRSLAAVDNVPMTETEIANAVGKNCNYFTDFGSLSLTQKGLSAAGEFLDLVRDRDWYNSRLQTLCLQALANSGGKVPFTNAGIATIESAVRAATKEATDSGFLDPESISFIVPKVADTSSTDRGNRRLRTIKVMGRAQGAIQELDILATITV